MNIIGIIPSRYGSSRFPGKPLADIAGKPMIQRVYQCAEACPEITQIFVVTDSERISECVRQFGGKTIITDRSHQTGTDRVAEAALKIGLGEDDLIINIQGDQVEHG